MEEKPQKPSRRQHILESVAHMLEVSPGARITTAALASEVGVSEAALYRHFPSKSKMFEGLIEFIEDTIFSRNNAPNANISIVSKLALEHISISFDQITSEQIIKTKNQSYIIFDLF